MENVSPRARFNKTFVVLKPKQHIQAFIISAQ